MENYFLDKYKSKSRRELELIVANETKYKPEAVKAAHILLKDVKEINEIELSNSPIEALKEENNQEFSNGQIALSFDHKPFLRTLSYREFLTGIALALLFNSLNEIIGYYSNERFFEYSSGAMRGVLFFAVILGNHVYYRFEHRRSNNLIGRSLSDLILMMIILVSKAVYEFIFDHSYRLNMEISIFGFIFIILGILIMAIGFEIGVAFLKFLLKRVKCQIF